VLILEISQSTGRKQLKFNSEKSTLAVCQKPLGNSKEFGVLHETAL
jgi:hypothetical protein